MRKRALALLLGLLLLGSLAGCGSMDGSVSSLLKVPKANAMQQKLRLAIDASLGSNIRALTPQNGDFRSSFVMNDLDGDGRDEAVIFFASADGNGGESSGIAVFAQERDGSWTMKKRVVGESSGIDTVSFLDCSGDGKKDLLIGWTRSETAKELFVYDLASAGSGILYRDAYNECRLFTDDTGAPFVFLAAFDRSQGVGEGRVLALDADGRLFERCRCVLDAHFSSVAALSYARVGTARRAVILDTRDGNNALTQFLFYDGKTLENPFYQNGVLSPLMIRETSLTCTDIDKDGVFELPGAVAMPSVSAAAGNALTPCALTTWSTLTRKTGDWGLEQDFSCVMAGGIGCYYIVPDSWYGRVSVYLNGEDSSLIFFDGTTRLFSIHRLSKSDFQKRQVLGSWYELYRSGDLVYTIHMEKNLTADQKLLVGTVEESRSRLIRTD